jgi:hypothetical protein
MTRPVYIEKAPAETGAFDVVKTQKTDQRE